MTQVRIGIVDPGGQIIAGPARHEETILYADLDTSRIAGIFPDGQMIVSAVKTRLVQLTEDAVSRGAFGSLDRKVPITKSRSTMPSSATPVTRPGSAKRPRTAPAGADHGHLALPERRCHARQPSPGRRPPAMRGPLRAGQDGGMFSAMTTSATPAHPVRATSTR